jgi:hypothetical protein
MTVCDCMMTQYLSAWRTVVPLGVMLHNFTRYSWFLIHSSYTESLVFLRLAAVPTCLKVVYRLRETAFGRTADLVYRTCVTITCLSVVHESNCNLRGHWLENKRQCSVDVYHLEFGIIMLLLYATCKARAFFCFVLPIPKPAQ